MIPSQNDRLSDYEIAINFGDTLSLIYKAKMAELNEDLKEAYALIDKISVPQVPEWHREFCKNSMPHYHQHRFTAIEHIQKIRKMYKKMKNSPEESEGNQLNIEKARNVPIDSIYDFHRKGKNVSCPWHEDKHPSASIKYNQLVCFQCGYKGDAIKLFMDLNKVSFRDAVKTLSS